MKKCGLRFHHLGLAVAEPTAAVAFLEGLGYSIGEMVFDEIQNVFLIFSSSRAQPSVEIIWPGPKPGPLDKMIQKHPAGLVYHICYSSDDLEASLSSLAAAGLRAMCIAPPKPAVLFSGRHVSFYQIAGIGLVEIIEAVRGGSGRQGPHAI